MGSTQNRCPYEKKKSSSNGVIIGVSVALGSVIVIGAIIAVIFLVKKNSGVSSGYSAISQKE